MPRESIQITGIYMETLKENHVRVTIRTPDNASFVIYEGDPRDQSSLFVGAQAMVVMKRESQKKVTDARVSADQPTGE